MKIIYYDKQNVDHILFCCLYKIIYGPNNVLTFIEYHDLNNKSLIDIQNEYSIIFLEYLPIKAWYQSMLNYNIKEFILYTTKKIELKLNIDDDQNIGDGDDYQNIFDNTLIEYNNKIHNYIHCNTNTISNYLLLKDFPIILNYTRVKFLQLKSLIEIFEKTANPINIKFIIIQQLLKENLTGNSFEIVYENLFLIGLIDNINNIYYEVLPEKNINHNLIKNKFDLFCRDIKWNIIHRNTITKKYIETEENKQLFYQEKEDSKIKLIQIQTTDIQRSLLLHNFLNMFLNKKYDGTDIFGKLDYDFIEYHNPLSKQSVYIPNLFYISNVSRLNFELSNYYNTKQDELYLLTDYYNKHILNQNVLLLNIDSNLSEINPLYTLVQNNINDYTNTITQLVNTKYGTKLKV